MREYGFELQLCANLEDGERLVARQLGAGVYGRRVMDIVVLEPGPAFTERTAITSSTIPPRAIESDIGPGRATLVRDVDDCHPETAKAAIDAGFFERTRYDGQPALRQTTRYPNDWVDSLIGIECKPDLDQPGALETQLLFDANLGLFDRIVLVTASHVTGAHLNRLPKTVGVWEFDADISEVTVVREPEAISTNEPGVEIVGRSNTQTDIRIASAADLSRFRRRLAERAYGKGWRPQHLPSCSRAEPNADGVANCPWKKRIVHPPSDCGPCCDGYDPADEPDVDRQGRRADFSPWEPDPPGCRRTQSGLDRF